MEHGAASPQCPNCGGDVVIPKSTKAFICRHCDALLKAFSTESGEELKLLGKSVDENEEYQALDDEVGRLGVAVQDLHSKYEFEAIRSYGKAPARLKALALVLLIAGAVAWLAAPGPVATSVVATGLVAFVAGRVARRSQRKARQARLAELGRELEAAARQRDTLAARAARIKVTST